MFVAAVFNTVNTQNLFTHVHCVCVHSAVELIASGEVDHFWNMQEQE